ncbi:IS66 family insertion sequence element accessory protein TnpA [Sodalis ligni]|uniref:IS66 family insertion sequence element accessory protein TnpA n=1 Tax=Sodalis ligni TaxID=2697027 RepID=UPI003B84A4B0
MIKRHTRAEQQQHIDAWKLSGLTKQDYCEQQGITLSNFYYWMKNHNNNTDTAPAASAFIPARRISVDVNRPEAVTLNLPNGCSVSCLPAQLRSVMQALSLC